MAAAQHVRVHRDVCAHTHDFAEISLVTGGSAQHVSEHGTATLSPGTLMLLGPSSWHAINHASDLTLTNVYLSTRLLEVAIPDEPFSGVPLATLNSVRMLGAVTLRSLTRENTEALSNTLDEFVRASHTTVFAQLAAVYTVLDQLAEMHEAPPLAQTEPRVTEHTSAARSGIDFSPRIGHAVAMLTDRLEHPWSLNELASAVAVSPSQLTRGFRSELETGPMSYLQQLRAERMAYLLRTTELTVSAAGKAVGWADPSYASRRFSKHWGMSPSWYLVSVQTSTGRVAPGRYRS